MNRTATKIITAPSTCALLGLSACGVGAGGGGGAPAGAGTAKAGGCDVPAANQQPGPMTGELTGEITVETLNLKSSFEGFLRRKSRALKRRIRASRSSGWMTRAAPIIKHGL